MKRHSSPRGFTLIELMVALGMALAITSAALTVMLLVVDTQREGQKRNALARDAQLAMDTLGYDLGFLGVGVPRGYEADDDGNVIGTEDDPTVTVRQLRPTVRIAQADYLAFLGDLPYPNADLNGVAQPSMLRGNPDELDETGDAVSVLSELSGCAPGTNCDTSRSTLNVAGNCSTGANTLSSCPWGLNKWRDDSGSLDLVFGSFDGRWWRRRVQMTGGVPATITDNGRKMIQLTSVGGVVDLPANAFIGPRSGGGFISQMDRVFYSLETPAGAACGTGAGCVLRRKQCWHWDIATTNPDDTGFPVALGAPQRSSGGVISDCTPGGGTPEGTPWESLVEDVKSLTFQYYDANGTQLTNTASSRAELSRVRTIRVLLTLERDLGKGKLLAYTLARQFYLENAGGIISDPATDILNGGCWSHTDSPAGPANECNPQ